MAQHRHKRETNARLARLTGLGRLRPRVTRVAPPLAFLATAAVVGVGVAAADVEPADLQLSATPSGLAAVTSADAETPLAARAPTVSRGLERRAPEKLSKAERWMKPRAVARALDDARGRDAVRWTTAPLNLWAAPGADAEQRGELAAGEKVRYTGRSMDGRDEIVADGFPDGATRWVTAGYLTEQEPFSLGGECTNGTSVPSGVSPNIVKVHQAVCAAFPDIDVYGTFRSDGEHSQGLAIDIMVTGEEGYRIAEFVKKYYVELGVNYIIWSQKIWSVDRSGEGWRGMEDRGSVTANHYDHVHVTTY